MKVVGITRSTNADGVTKSSIYVEEDFDRYFNNPAAGRSCEGKKYSSLYVGEYDCSKIKVGMEIDIFYEKAITTAKGTFQPIKRIDVISK